MNYLATWGQTYDPHGMRSHLFLHTLVPRWDSLKSSHTFKSFTPTVSLVRQHATDSSLEDLGWSTVVKRAASRVDITPLAKEAKKLNLVPVKKNLN